MPKRLRETRVFPIVLRRLEVLAVADVTPGMRRVTVGGRQLRAFRSESGIDLPELRSDGFDDHLKLFFAEPGADPVLPVQNPGNIDWPRDPRPIAKDYTPRRYDVEAGELDLDFVRHGTGYASTWAERAQVGDAIYTAGPKVSELHPADADWYLIFGDETALPAIGRWLEEMPSDARGQVFVEVAEPEHEQDLRHPPGVELTWLHRHGAAPGSTDLLELAVRGAEFWPGDVYAWGAGEADSLKPIRRFLRDERDVPRERLDVTGYWRRTELAVAEDGSTALGVADMVNPVHERLHELTDLVGPYALRVAVTLRIPDHVARGRTSVEALAAATGTHPRALAALVRYLVSEDVLGTDDDGALRLGALGGDLVDDEHEVTELDLGGAQAHLDLAIAGLAATLRSGASSYASTFGRSLAEHAEEDEAFRRELFDAVTERARWARASFENAFGWGEAGRVVVVGPTASTVAEGVLAATTTTRVSVVDLPSRLPLVREALEEHGLTDRFDAVARSPLAPLGDLGADVVVLAPQLLETLPDEDARLVLAQLRDVDAGVVVLDRLAEDDPDGLSFDVGEDLVSWCVHGSARRTRAELAELVSASGLTTVEERGIGWGITLLRLAPA
ncbi:Siderophore-interacting protein [Beutenbergia cavernae DSM 12333]|uniref:Siderophore-interacting protein n=1 Tax=Beutenbergia cavernae (strain ATCC BAA-8 / DSM 12333 / CCUG 43141 / JCM 11478 / NBRC 16432 / NCIMB 13614 / HKI 0122) TaxID=471853 RepID=C5BXC3_BEUC1|nr:siderophore-interacting protein [Beutenbergia cavernae]ACQ78798.1 Siderophore-interacting protein [Beutenbergia cavernae DSM 12333]